MRHMHHAKSDADGRQITEGVARQSPPSGALRYRHGRSAVPTIDHIVWRARPEYRPTRAAVVLESRNVPFRNTGDARDSNWRGQATAAEVDMRFRNPGERSVHRQLAGLAAVAALTCASAWANPQSEASAGSGASPPYGRRRSLPSRIGALPRSTPATDCRTRCDSVLLELGARPDLQVRGFGCTRLAGAGPVRRCEHQDERPAAGRPARRAGRAGALEDGRSPDPTTAIRLTRPQTAISSADPAEGPAAVCDAQCRLQRHLRSSIMLLIGGTRLKAEVLVADQRAAAAPLRPGKAARCVNAPGASAAPRRPASRSMRISRRWPRKLRLRNVSECQLAGRTGAYASTSPCSRMRSPLKP